MEPPIRTDSCRGTIEVQAPHTQARLQPPTASPEGNATQDHNPSARALCGGTPSSPWSQCFSRSYASILPTSLGHIAPLTRGYSPRSPDAVIGTAELVREATKQFHRHPKAAAGLQGVRIWISDRAFRRIVKAPRTAQKGAPLSLCVQTLFST